MSHTVTEGRKATWHILTHQNARKPLAALRVMRKQGGRIPGSRAGVTWKEVEPHTDSSLRTEAMIEAQSLLSAQEDKTTFKR